MKARSYAKFVILSSEKMSLFRQAIILKKVRAQKNCTVEELQDNGVTRLCLMKTAHCRRISKQIGRPGCNSVDRVIVNLTQDMESSSIMM
ncbi:hypothetical protein KIN20_001839 [Parelaphostrongylus tenuis]|uniref:Uncharacterized protein n=1 Tax=Parelaphostrongylus tenuis TaxID=148309 RepID=A0AAD5LXK4_PARTN|nr:hypothetical protein KIN20_001839 [Parelaphostrongylus tenuis]